MLQYKKGGGDMNYKMFEIEIHSYCNRTCEWCPNSFIDRRSETVFLDETLYLKALSELGSDYDGVISYSRYNEPTSKKELFKKRIAQARELCPNAKLVTNTNGDYLNPEYINELDIDEITIMDYDNKGLEWCIARLESWNAEVYSKDDTHAYATLNGKKIGYSSEWSLHNSICDRGGSLEDFSLQERTEPCFEPTYFIGVDYNGNVTPCCNVRSDNPIHEDYILGNIKHQSIDEIYNSDKAVRFREQTASGNFDGLDPCKHCNKKAGRYTRPKGGFEY